MRIAVVGAGIKGVLAAWALARRGFSVELFERGTPTGETSSASTKLLHGGLRYLETGHVSIVREGLAERAWWIGKAPELAHRPELLLSVRRRRGRPRRMVKAGLVLYDLLSGRRRLGSQRWLGRDEVIARLPGLCVGGLTGAYSFWDGQVDDRALGPRALGRATEAGVTLHPGKRVESITKCGELCTQGAPAREFAAICNVCGPWAEDLLAASGRVARHRMRLLHGSHILVDGTRAFGRFIRAPSDDRVCFVLPYLGRVMVGTTEAERAVGEPIVCIDAERDYLIDVCNANFDRPIGPADVRERFAGVRPLLAEPGDPNANTCESAFERHGRGLTVFGSKWTAARVFGEQFADEIEGRR